MTRTIRPVSWLRYIGLIAWGLAALVLLMLPTLATSLEKAPQRAEMAAAWFAIVVFMVVYWRTINHLSTLRTPAVRMVLLALLVLCALVVTLMSKTGIGIILMFAIAALMPWMLPFWAGVVWIVVSAIPLHLYTYTLTSETEPGFWLLNSGVNLGLMMMFFIASYFTRHLHHARLEVRRVNSELRATQALLQENTRIAERVRIARELHDLIGHHLTALSLNLEVASHLATGKAREHVEQGRSIARLLLADVREVVSDMRRDDQVDLAHALRELVAGMPEPTIHLDIPEELPLTDPNRAQILLRCAQEVITNTVRHAQAQNLWLTLRPGGDGLELLAHDDGLGAGEVTLGNGLTGMRERLRELGGRVDINTSHGAGFRLQLWMPREGTS